LPRRFAAATPCALWYAILRAAACPWGAQAVVGDLAQALFEPLDAGNMVDPGCAAVINLRLFHWQGRLPYSNLRLIPKPDEPEPNRGYDGSLMDDRESDHGYGDA
jgi:hypothetical protein